VAALGLYFVIGAIAWTTFIYNGIPVPDSFTTILATIAGGLVGVLAPTAGPARSSEPRRRSGHRHRPSSTGEQVCDHAPLRSRGQPCWVMLTIQGMPNRSVHMPNSSPHICFSRGMVTVPPSDSFSQ
jgi:hypothetical protein